MKRTTWPVRYLTDETAQPPRRQEVITRSPSAMAFWLGGTYDRPEHGCDACLVGAWAVISITRPAGVMLPVFIHYDRAAGALPFETCGRRYAQLGEAMEGAVTDA
jgi:hypothetical protein